MPHLRKYLPLALLAVTTISISALVAQQPSMRGFTPAEATAERSLEAKARQLSSAARVGEFMRAMASEPHHAGTPASRKVAEYIRTNLERWGWNAEIEQFDVLLPYPRQRRLEMISPQPYVASIMEPPIEQDDDTSDTNQLATFNAYGGNGDVTAPLIYVNYGTPEDYAAIDKLGISLKGKIVVARYGRCWRGIKAKLAQERGALGCLIYSDPADDGYGKGASYPEGPYRPPRGVQRGSVMDMPIYPGDPTTPFTASVAGVKRLSVEESPTILKIPVLPISHDDARPLLEALSGREAPHDWQGGLRFTYHLGAPDGPGAVRVRLQVESEFAIRPIYNVIATLKGKDFPDEWVLYGNHHDAWVNGAHDPVSGTAVVLETGRVLGELAKTGWRPSRTIKLCLWDGEEFGIIGSTEWVEKHAAELQTNLVAYFNSDSNGRGTLRAAGSQHLAPFLREVMADVPDTALKQSVLEAATQARNIDLGETRRFQVDAAGSGSDYAPFLHHITMPSLNLGFSGGCPAGGIYHSVYDTLAWYEKFCDPGNQYGRLFSEVMLTALLRLSSASVLPYDFGELASSIRSYRKEVAALAREYRISLNFEPLDRALSNLTRESAEWNNWSARHLQQLTTNRARQASINRQLIVAERQLALENGLPNRPWYRHPIYAPGLYTGYGVKTLPGVREAIEQREPDVARQYLALTADSVERLSTHLRRLRAEAESSAPAGRTPASSN
ncbi:MAG: M28 family peptidase [Bryobacterales bacterium]|nr:M28 family peptidase [Bryobacterales bacterium]